MSPVIDNSSATGEKNVSRYIYQFSDGSNQYIANYVNGISDTGAEISIPKGAIVEDISMKLSGVSSTGWSDYNIEDRDDWILGSDSLIDNRGDTLTLALDGQESTFFSHGIRDSYDNSSDAWLDHSTGSLRQPHTSSSLEPQFAQQNRQSSSAFSGQSQGAVLKHHDWLFLSTWSSSQFSNVVKRLYPNNATVESTITLEQSTCDLPDDPSSSFRKSYGFRDWTVTDDERMFGIFTTYRNHYSAEAPAHNHMILEFDISDDNVWTCLESYDIQDVYSEYTAIAYDKYNDKFWIVHNAQRKIVGYDFDNQPAGDFTRDDFYYRYFSAGNSAFSCGKSGNQVRGLEVNETTFFMRCQKSSVSQDTLEAWSLPLSGTDLVPPQTTGPVINNLGYGLFFDGQRFISVDCGYSSFVSQTLYYREFGTGWEYNTTPSPGVSTFISNAITTDQPILSAYVQTHWSSVATGDKVDYWISSDNGIHWETVQNNYTIHFSNPGTNLVWKAQLTGSSAVSWWFNIDYFTSYSSSGTWTSDFFQTPTNVAKVRPEWDATIPLGSSIDIRVSNDNGTNWMQASENQVINFPSEYSGSDLRFEVNMQSSDSNLTPFLESFTLWYEEGYPDRPAININEVGSWDWQSVVFLNGSTIIASDSSVVGTEVSSVPNLVGALNAELTRNGVGDDLITLAFKAASPGRIKITDLNVEYKLQTRAIDFSFDTDNLVPDGEYKVMKTRVGLGDDANGIERTLVELVNSNGPNPSFLWENGDSCTELGDFEEVAYFDIGNCTSTMVDEIMEIHIPIKTFWEWDDESSLEGLISVVDDNGLQVSSWQTIDSSVKLENDIELKDLKVYDEEGNRLINLDWIRGGNTLSFSGTFSFEGTEISPPPGQFNLRIVGQNVSQSGQLIDEPIILAQQSNPSFGRYNISFISPIESSPGGMIFYAEAVDLANGSNYANRGSNNIKLVLDGKSPIVISSTPSDGDERGASQPAPSGQPISIVVQDSVDPPATLTLRYWLGCFTTQSLSCTDFNFDGLPNADEYQSMTLSSPEIQSGGLNIFEGLIDDSMLTHEQVVSYFVTGSDSKSNILAMGGTSVCPVSTQICGAQEGQVMPNWDADLGTYTIREEFAPQIDLSNSTIIGHEDESPLHPGIPYDAVISIEDGNGWNDVEQLELYLSGDVADRENLIIATITNDGEGIPKLHVVSRSDDLAVSNLYSYVSLDELSPNKMIVSIRFQLTWEFSELFDTNGESFFMPIVSIFDKSCTVGDAVPCHEINIGLGENLWSLDNDFIFDTVQGHIKAIELRNGENHYTEDYSETVIGQGQAIKVSGRILFSEDNTPAPEGFFGVLLQDDNFEWSTSIRKDGEFEVSFLIPPTESGHLDISFQMSDLPGEARDSTPSNPRLRLAVDEISPQFTGISINNLDPGEPIPISAIDNLSILVDTYDNYGFGQGESIMLQYRIRAGVTTIASSSILLSEYELFEGYNFWQKNVDLTDSGATMLLTTYELDVWVIGADKAGNPFSTESNSQIEPFATWPFYLSGPQLDLFSDSTIIRWDDPSPSYGETVGLLIKAENTGGEGELEFILESQTELGKWVQQSNITSKLNPLSQFTTLLVYEVPSSSYENLNFRLLVKSNGLEVDRISIEPLIITESTPRDGEALAKQASDEIFSITLFVIALVSISFGLWMLVITRRLDGDEDVPEGLQDNTQEVIDSNPSTGKQVPEISTPNVSTNQTPIPQTVQEAVKSIAPLPPTGLPPGWSMEQWEHYGWQYMDALRR